MTIFLQYREKQCIVERERKLHITKGKCKYKDIFRINYFGMLLLVLTHAVVQLVGALRYRLKGHGFSAQLNFY